MPKPAKRKSGHGEGQPTLPKVAPNAPAAPAAENELNVPSPISPPQPSGSGAPDAAPSVPAEPATTPPQTDGTSGVPTPQPRDLAKTTDLFDLINTAEEQTQRQEIANHITKILTRYRLLPRFTVVMMIDEGDAIASYHANEIYKTLSASPRQKDVLLILSSNGGRIEPGFLLSKTCKRLAKDRFIVAVPRRAKSAATLIALGADEIHMGIMSELGPIDPQIGGFPALGVQNSLGVVADLVTRYPESAELFARYLSRNLELQNLGYLARVPESAAQYAERLLRGKALGKGQTPEKLARHFVEHYKDHAFVIDVDESKSLLGPMIVQESPEYSAANDIYQFFDLTRRLFSMLKHVDTWYVGPVETGFSCWRASK